MIDDRFFTTGLLKAPNRPGGEITGQFAGQGDMIGMKNLNRAEADQFGIEKLINIHIFAAQLSGGKLAGGDVHVGNSGAVLVEEAQAR